MHHGPSCHRAGTSRSSAPATAAPSRHAAIGLSKGDGRGGGRTKSTANGWAITAERNLTSPVALAASEQEQHMTKKAIVSTVTGPISAAVTQAEVAVVRAARKAVSAAHRAVIGTKRKATAKRKSARTAARKVVKKARRVVKRATRRAKRR